MRILLLSQWFEPEPVFKGLEFAKALMARGHDVEVLTGLPNYPGGRLYSGYTSRLLQHEVQEGVRVHRVWLYPSHDQSAYRRVVNYASFAAAASVLGPLVTSKPDVVYAYHPPPTIAAPAFTLRWWWNVPVVYDVQDLWPDTVATTGMLRSGRAIRLLDRICRSIYRSADHITVLSPGFKQVMIERGVPDRRVHVVYNWAAETSLERREPDPIKAMELGLYGDRFVVMFAGTMGAAQGLESVLRAAEICQRTVPQALFAFVGGGIERERLMDMSLKRGLQNTRFIPFQPISAMAAILALADILLVHLRDEDLFRITIPSKTQAYLASGKPILMAVRGDAAEIVKRANAGFVCAPGDPEALADAVARAASLSHGELSAMGRRGLEYYRSELSLAAGAAAFERVFQTAIKDHMRSR